MAQVGILSIGARFFGRERETPVVSTEDETQFFEPCGEFGLVRLQTGGNGVFLNLDQLKLLRERSGLNGFDIKRQENGMYLVNMRK